MRLQATGITKSYNVNNTVPTQVLRGVDIECHEGEFVAIMGPSGAGKSTLMHILATLETPDAGSVKLVLDGVTHCYERLSQRDLASLRNSHIGIVYQFHHLLPEFTTLENVMLPLLIGGESQTKAREASCELLDAVGMSARLHHTPSELSGGEQQRVSIARALVTKPAILFADEPTGNLDSANATAVAELLAGFQHTFSTTCIVATHSEDLASRAHRIVRMQDGHIVG